VIQEFVDRGQYHVVSLRSSFNVGLDILGTAQVASTRQAHFFGWTGQAQYRQRLGESANQLVFTASFQWADQPLRAPELFSIGGAGTVRGYRENQVVRDAGMIASVEFRVPVWRNDRGMAIVQLAPFVDYGRGWNVHSPTPDPSDLASVGLGLLVTPHEKFSAQLYWGYAFRDLNPRSRDAQDLGLHFKVHLSFF